MVTTQDKPPILRQRPEPRTRWHAVPGKPGRMMQTEYYHLDEQMELGSFKSTLVVPALHWRIWKVVKGILPVCAKTALVFATGYCNKYCGAASLALFVHQWYTCPSTEGTTILTELVDGAQAVDENAEDLTATTVEPGPQSHGRRRPKAPLVARFILEGKLRFGTPKMTAGNYAAVRRYISGLLTKPDNDIRRSDQALILDAVTAAIFVPSQHEIAAAVALDDESVRRRQASFASTRLGSLTV